MIWTTGLDDGDDGKMLYTCGCSFTIGDELGNSRLQSYPTLLSVNMKKDILINQARCGASNYEILRKTMDFLLEYVYERKLDTKDLDVVIGWSLISRYEYYTDHWEGITPNSVSKKQDAPYYYYGLFQSTEKDMLDFMWHVSVAESFLKKHNINYFFFKIDTGQHTMWNQTGAEIIDGFDLNKLTTPRYLDNIDLEKFPSLTDPSQTFREFALEHAGLKPQHHPNEKAHELFAKYLQEKLND